MVQKLIEGQGGGGGAGGQTPQSGWPASKLRTEDFLNTMQAFQPFRNVQFCPISRVVMYFKNTINPRPCRFLLAQHS